MAHRKQSALVGLHVVHPRAQFFHLDRRDLDRILDVLNRGPQWLYSEPLIRLMNSLNECGGNLKKMMDGDPELKKVVEKVCVTQWEPSTNRRAILVPQPAWEYIRELKPEPGGPGMRPDRYAALLFHVGTLNPEWDKLAGPCARCGRYYIKKRESQKVYCSRQCGNAATAVTRTRERIKAEHTGKMNRAEAAIKKWRRTKSQQGWKRWVSQKTRIDLRFLTRNFTDTGEAITTRREN